MRRQHSLISTLGLGLGLVLMTSGCGDHEKPNFIYMPDMVYSKAYKAQQEDFVEGRSVMRVPPKGTIPRGFQPYAYAGIKDPTEAAKVLAADGVVNPLKRTPQVLARGQAMFNTYCIVCHGALGLGDGSIIGKFPRPPSLQSDKVIHWSDAMIYHTVTMGQNLMPSYASQIAPADRWAIIHYVRAIERAKHPTPEDLKAANQESQ